MYKRCIIICLILLLSIQMYGCKPDVEKEKCETNVQYDTACSETDQPKMTDRKLQTEDTETSEGLTKREALDLVFAHYTDSTDEMFDLSFFEMKDGKIGYTWKWENTQDSPAMFLAEIRTIVYSKEEKYLLFRVYSDVYGSSGDFIGTEIEQEYAINLTSGQIIRVYDESGLWEYSNDNCRYILGNVQDNGESASSEEEQVKDRMYSFVEDSVSRQEELCSAIGGKWTFVDFFIPHTGGPSKDSAEDYLNKEIRLYEDNNELVLEYNDRLYQLDCVRPVVKRYLADAYKYSLTSEGHVIDGYTCELVFIYDADHLIEIYVNEKGKLFLHIGEASVADYACFTMERTAECKEEEMELAFFQDKAERLLDECKLHHRYSNLEIDRSDGSETKFFTDNDILLEVEEQNIIMQIENETLQLEKVEEVSGLNVKHAYAYNTQCWRNQSALLYTFVNENYEIQIMERSDGESFIRVNFGETEGSDIYTCSNE